MLGDAERREKFWVVRQNFGGCLAAVKFTEQSGDGLHDERIRIANEKIFSVPALRDKPKFGEAAGNQIFLHAQFWRERRNFFGAFNEERETVLSVFQGGQFGGELLLLFREGHGAESFLFSSRWRFWAFSRRRGGGGRCFAARLGGAAFGRWTPRFIAALIVTTRTALVVLRRLRLLWRTLRLDAAQGATQFFEFALIHELLAVGDFDEF